MATKENINLVTGYTGTAHVRSEDDALLNAFLAKQDNSVINLEEIHTSSAIDVNADVLVKGRLIRTDGNIELTIPTQPSGYYAFDTIYICYQKNTSGIESAYLEYCSGTPSTNEETARNSKGEPTQPASTSGWEKFKLYDVAWATNQTFEVIPVNGGGDTVTIDVTYGTSSSSVEMTKIPMGNGFFFYTGVYVHPVNPKNIELYFDTSSFDIVGYGRSYNHTLYIKASTFKLDEYGKLELTQLVDEGAGYPDWFPIWFIAR